VEDLKANADEYAGINRQDLVVARKTFASQLKASKKPVEGDPVIEMMDRQVEIIDTIGGVADRMRGGSGSEASSVVAEFLTGKDQVMQRIQQYSDESGVSEIVGALKERYKDYQDPDGRAEYRDERKGLISNYIRTSNGGISIRVDSKGTVRVVGQRSSKIKESEWREDPELVGKAVVKALEKKNPFSWWPGRVK
jgi:hypothetical protein